MTSMLKTFALTSLLFLTSFAFSQGDTTTTILGLTKPGHLTHVGNWDSVYNADFDMIDSTYPLTTCVRVAWDGIAHKFYCLPAIVEGDITNLLPDLALKAPLISPAFIGTPTAPTTPPLDGSTNLATTAYSDAAVSVEKVRALAAETLKAPLLSPALTGSPTAPTATALDNSTKIGTTAYADSAVATEVTARTIAVATRAPLVHTHIESDVNNLVSDLAATEKTANKAVANGYASIDSGGHIPIAQMPSSLTVPITPLMIPASGTYGAAQAVSIISPGADNIYYTTDGSAPNSIINSFGAQPSAGTWNPGGVYGYHFQVTIPIVVSSLGRPYLAGNSQDHGVSLWISTNTSTPLTSGTVLAASVSDANGFKWVAVTPVTLTPGNTYTVQCDEFSGGDIFYNQGLVTLQGIFTNVVSAYSVGALPGTYATGTNAVGQSYSAPAMLYSSTHIYYGATISISTSALIRAVAVKAGANSAVGYADYSIITPVTKANAYGDSITSGFGLSTPSTQNWAAVFAADKSFTLLNNYSVSGASMPDDGEIPQAYLNTSPTADTTSIILVGANDLGNASLSPSNIPIIESGYRAFTAWLGLPYFLKTTANQGIAFSGSWTPFSIFNLPAQSSSTTNDTATGTVIGSTVYVAGKIDSTDTRTVNISVDGISQGSYILTDPLVNSSATAYPYCIRIPGLSLGSHTVQVKLTSAGTGAVTVQWMGGNGITSQLPRVGIGNTIARVTNNEATQLALNAATLAMVNDLIADGLSVVYVDDASVVSIPGDYQAGGVHPTAAGAILIANKWVATF